MKDPWVKRRATTRRPCDGEGCDQWIEPGEMYWHNVEINRALCLDQRAIDQRHKLESALNRPRITFKATITRGEGR